MTVALDADQRTVDQGTEVVDTRADDGKYRRFTVPLMRIRLEDAMAFEVDA